MNVVKGIRAGVEVDWLVIVLCMLPFPAPVFHSPLPVFWHATVTKVTFPGCSGEVSPYRSYTSMILQVHV